MSNPHTNNPHHIFSPAHAPLPLCPHASHAMVTFRCVQGSSRESSSLSAPHCPSKPPSGLPAFRAMSMRRKGLHGRHTPRARWTRGRSAEWTAGKSAHSSVLPVLARGHTRLPRALRRVPAYDVRARVRPLPRGLGPERAHLAECLSALALPAYAWPPFGPASLARWSYQPYLPFPPRPTER